MEFETVDGHWKLSTTRQRRRWACAGRRGHRFGFMNSPIVRRTSEPRCVTLRRAARTKASAGSTLFNSDLSRDCVAVRGMTQSEVLQREDSTSREASRRRVLPEVLRAEPTTTAFPQSIEHGSVCSEACRCQKIEQTCDHLVVQLTHHRLPLQKTRAMWPTFEPNAGLCPQMMSIPWHHSANHEMEPISVDVQISGEEWLASHHARPSRRWDGKQVKHARHVPCVWQHALMRQILRTSHLPGKKQRLHISHRGSCNALERHLIKLHVKVFICTKQPQHHIEVPWSVHGHDKNGSKENGCTSLYELEDLSILKRTDLKPPAWRAGLDRVDRMFM